MDQAALLRPFLVALPATGLAAGFAARLAGYPDLAAPFWIAATLPVLVALVVQIVTSLRRGDLGLDIVAALSMSAALAFGETLAAAVVSLMYAGGQYLEGIAERRARAEMTALLARVPRTAIRHRNGALEEIELAQIAPGDRLLVRRGDIVAADGTVASGVAVLDESAITGESLPVRHDVGAAILSGVTNMGDAFDLSASSRAEDSTFARIVRLVEAAGRSKAPMARLADRYAVGFLLATIVIAAGAAILSGDPIRAVAVLVVATPCPLILAVPVALVGGLSRAASEGILIKSGAALETLARIRTIILDKTGTLTEGRAKLVAIDVDDGTDPDKVLRLAASLDQASQHSMARTIVETALEHGFALSVPENVEETAGEGVIGRVDGHDVVVGGLAFVAARLGLAGSQRDRERPAGTVAVAVAVDGHRAGVLILADELRSGTSELLEEIRAGGVARFVLATGDRHDVALAVTDGVGVDTIHADLKPEEKVAIVLAERQNGPVMMIGDGVNDAPALAAADLGVAMGARGAAAAAEAADVVLLVDRLDRIATALAVGRRSRRIALQSVVVGIGLSLIGMLAAAFGYLAPVQGALLQEAIDVAVIANALRTLRHEVPAPGHHHGV